MFEHHRGVLTGDSTTSECFWSLYHPITIKLGRGKGSLVSCQSPQVANDSKAWAPVSRTCRWRSRAWVWPILALPCWWAPVMAVFPSSAWAPSWPSWSHQWFSQCPQKSLKCHEMSRSTIAVELNMYSRPCFWNLLERYAGTGSPIYLPMVIRLCCFIFVGGRFRQTESHGYIADRAIGLPSALWNVARESVALCLCGLPGQIP